MALQVSLQKVELKSPEFRVGGLKKSTMFAWLPKTASVANSWALVEDIASEIPTDGREIVEWMHAAAADMAVLDAYSNEYSTCSTRGGGVVYSSSGDGYIPGVRVQNIRGESVPSSTVRSRGYGRVITPYGSFNVPVGGKALFAYKDLLVWAALPFTYGIQWLLSILNWARLAVAPITDRVRFPSCHGKVAPNFFSVQPSFPSPVCLMRIGISSDKPQTIQIRGRGPSGSFHNVLFEDSFDVSKGENEIVYYVTGFPFVQNFTLELQPQDGTETVLDYLEVYP